MKAHVTIPRAAAVTHLMRVAVAVACLFPYLQVLHHGFVAVDDQLHTYLNPILNGYVPQGMGAFWTAPYMDLYIPVTYTVWALVHAVSGGGTQWAPMPFHGTNLLLHIANAVLAFEILRLMLRSLGPSSVAKAPQPAFATEGRITIGAGLGAFVFALHPLQVEAVAWVSGLKDVLSGTLALVSLLLFLCSDMEREHQFPLRFVSSLLCMALAVLSKPSAVILPLLGFTLALTTVQHTKRPRRMLMRWATRAGVGLLVVAIPGVVITFQEQPIPPGTFVAPFWARPFVALDAVAFYLYKTVWPMALTSAYGRSPQAVLETSASAYGTWLLPVAVALGLLWWYRRTGSPAAWGSVIALLFFCLALVPVLGLIPFGYQLHSTVADRYAYLSMLGPAMILSVVVASTVSVPRLRVVMAGSAVLLLSLGTVTYHQAATWHDTLALATQMLRVSPGNGMSESTAGEAWLAAGDFERAATHLQRAVEVGPPSSVPFYSFELGLVKHLQGRLGEAAEWYRKATPSMGVVPGAQNNLGVLVLMEGKPGEAVPYFERALRFDAFLSPEPYFNLAEALGQIPREVERVALLTHRARQLEVGRRPNPDHSFWRRYRQASHEHGLPPHLRLMWPNGYPVSDSPEGY